jgi:RHS repeat-associated protein
MINSSSNSNVFEVNAYYPFGMIIPNLSLTAPPDKYNAYKFGAKELQRELELNWYDFGARMYQPSIARWWTPDPAAELYYSTSPYAYVRNNPINAIDPNGLWEELPNDYFDKFTGAYLGSDRDMRNDNVYLTTEYNWTIMKGEEWESRVPGSVSPDGHKISSRVAAGIFNHYYNEAGFSVNELAGGSVVPQVAGNFNWDIVGLTEYGSQYTGLGAGDLRISAEKHKMGGTLVTKYDYINMFVHEYDHFNDFKKNERAGLFPLYVDARDRSAFERNAIRTQVTHSSWTGTSPVFRDIIMRNALNYKVFNNSEIIKYFNYMGK